MALWKQIPGYPKYEVSSDGQVRKGDRIMKPDVLERGYAYLRIRNKDSILRTSVHRLVAMTFLENQNGYPCVDHIDGNTRNNSLENLRWCSPSMNAHNSRLSRRNKCGLSGVSKCGNKFRADIQAAGTKKYLGCFETPEAAFDAYIRAKREVFPELCTDALLQRLSSSVQYKIEGQNSNPEGCLRVNA